MRSQHIPLGLLLVASITGVFSVPISLTHDAPADDAEKDNLKNLNAATVEANRQIDLMETVIKDRKNPKHAPLIEAAFGTKADLDVVQKNIEKLKDNKKAVPIKLQAVKGNDVAFTAYDDTKNPWVATHVEFGEKYHKSSPAAQAGTLIHEASHYLADTGDYIKGRPARVLPGSDPAMPKKVGYTKQEDPYTTIEALNKDKNFPAIRDKTLEMEKNAESYTQFASLCANAGLRRREFHMYKRALADGDHEMAAHYLVRRQSCALPKAKKAAAAGDKKAASKLATTSKALSGLTAGAKKSALTPGSEKSALTAGAKDSKVGTTPKGRLTAGKKSALTPGAKKSALTGKKPSSKLTKSAVGTKGKLAGKGVASARKPTSKSPTGKRVASVKSGAAGAKKLGAGKKPATAKSLTKGAARAGAKKVAGARTPSSKSLAKGANRASSKKVAGSRTTKGAGSKKAAGAKALTKGSNRAGSKKVTGARATKGAASKKAGGPKALTKGAGSKKVAGARTPKSPTKAGSKKAVGAKSSTKGANRAGVKQAATRKPTSKVAGKSASKSPVKGAAGAKKVTSAGKPTTKVSSPNKGAGGAKKVAVAAAKSAPKQSTISPGKGAVKEIATPQNIKKAATLPATVASKGKKK